MSDEAHDQAAARDDTRPTTHRLRMITPAVAAVLGAATVIAGLASPVQHRQPVSLPEVATRQMGVCPVQDATGEIIGATAPGVSVRTLDGGAVSNPTGAVSGPVVVSQSKAGELLPPGVNLSASTGRTFAACSEPLSSSAVQVPDPSSADIVLVNPDKTEAVVNLALSSADGNVTSAGSRGLTVAPGQTRVVPISVLVPGSDPVTVIQSATQGRVVMVARTISGSIDQGPAQQPAQEVLLGGVSAGSTRTRLVIGNPGEDRVQVSVSALSGRGDYVPAGAEQVFVDPYSSVVLDLTQSLNHEASGLKVTAADGVIVASAEVRVGTDTALITPVSTGEKIDDIPAASVLQVMNPSDQPITVTLKSGDKTSSLRVAARGVAGTQVQAGQRLTLSSSTPIAATSIITGNGVAVQTLRPAVTKATQTQVDLDPRMS